MKKMLSKWATTIFAGLLITAFASFLTFSYMFSDAPMLYAPKEEQEWVEKQVEEHYKVIEQTAKFFFKEDQDVDQKLFIPDNVGYLFHNNMQEVLRMSEQNTSLELYAKITELSWLFENSAILFVSEERYNGIKIYTNREREFVSEITYVAQLKTKYSAGTELAPGLYYYCGVRQPKEFRFYRYTT